MAPELGPQKLLAIIPATGLSRRMGQPKLLLKVEGQTVIEHLVSQLQHAHVVGIAVSSRADDTPMQAVLERLPTVQLLVTPSPPPEMRESVTALVQHWAATHTGGWLLVPGDSPVVEPQVLERLIHRWQENSDRIVVPCHQGRRGHPTLFPATLPTELPRIPPDRGLNWLLRTQPERVVEVDCPEPSVLWDVDTPEDWNRFQALWKKDR